MQNFAGSWCVFITAWPPAPDVLCFFLFVFPPSFLRTMLRFGGANLAKTDLVCLCTDDKCLRIVRQQLPDPCTLRCCRSYTRSLRTCALRYELLPEAEKMPLLASQRCLASAIVLVSAFSQSTDSSLYTRLLRLIVGYLRGKPGDDSAPTQHSGSGLALLAPILPKEQAASSIIVKASDILSKNRW